MEIVTLTNVNLVNLMYPILLFNLNENYSDDDFSREVCRQPNLTFTLIYSTESVYNQLLLLYSFCFYYYTYYSV